MMKFYFYILFLLGFSFSITICCEQHTTCRKCIRDENKCVWCADEKYMDGVGCKSEVGLSGNWCSDHIINPKSFLKDKRADEFSSKKDSIVQLKPQEIKMGLRPGHPLNFDFTYKRAKNYPLDFYFVMDGSLSMRKYAQNTANHSKAMYDMLHVMTDDIHVGMGTFVDKNAMPYAEYIKNNSAYSFKNLLKLNEDYQVFHSNLQHMEFGANTDEPEAMMDALAQAMACKDEIGWRNQSRKIIVLNTDAGYHMAGHGRLAGIIQPYDGNCYTEKGIYTKELEMDYPSISILKEMATRDGFVIIFVVEKDKKDVYKALEEQMGVYVKDYDEKAVKDSFNVNDILKDIYNSITESIRLKNQIDSAYKDYFEIVIEPNCDEEDCSVRINEEKHFVGTIKLLKHLDADSIPIDIAISGLNEKLRLNVSIIKECDCAPELKSSYCNLNGNKTCGICECDPGWLGEHCQCSAAGNTDKDTERCIANGTECNERGVCKCGKCECKDNNFKGDFCECNLQNCVRGSNGKLCSGHGSCGETTCGVCSCEDHWTGDDCSCSTLQTNCKEDGKEICSGFGDCLCNRCTCRTPAPGTWDTRARDYLCRPHRETNETTVEALRLLCIQLQPCVLTYFNLKSSGCENVNITGVDILEIDTGDEEAVWIECPEIRCDVGCYTKFAYKNNDITYGVDVKVQTKFNCAETYLITGGGCLAGLILIGLVTLVCWKVITNRRDRAEYDRFFKEVQSENPEMINPIFEPAIISVTNPAYRRSRNGD